MVGFRAEGEVDKADFENVVLPAVKELVDDTHKLNYMLVLDTNIHNFTPGAWLEDAILGIKNITKWNRAAIVSDSEMVRKFTDVFSKVMPGSYKGFSHRELQTAIDWTSEKINLA